MKSFKVQVTVSWLSQSCLASVRSPVRVSDIIPYKHTVKENLAQNILLDKINKLVKSILFPWFLRIYSG